MVQFSVLENNFVWKEATQCGFFSKLFIPTFSSYLFNLIAIFRLYSHICYIYFMESRSPQSLSCHRYVSAFGNSSRFLSVSIFEHLPHHVLRKWVLSAARGVQSNNKWHWRGDGPSTEGWGWWGVRGYVHRTCHPGQLINLLEICWIKCPGPTCFWKRKDLEQW